MTYSTFSKVTSKVNCCGDCHKPNARWLSIGFGSDSLFRFTSFFALSWAQFKISPSHQLKLPNSQDRYLALYQVFPRSFGPIEGGRNVSNTIAGSA